MKYVILIPLLACAVDALSSPGYKHVKLTTTKMSKTRRKNTMDSDATTKFGLPNVKLVHFDDDYDFHVHPKPENEGEALNIYFSVNLRNILQVYT